MIFKKKHANKKIAEAKCYLLFLFLFFLRPLLRDSLLRFIIFLLFDAISTRQRTSLYGLVRT